MQAPAPSAIVGTLETTGIYDLLFKVLMGYGVKEPEAQGTDCQVAIPARNATD